MSGQRSYIPQELPPSRLRPRTQILLIIVIRFSIISIVLLSITLAISLLSGLSFFVVGILITLFIFIFGFMALRLFIKAFGKDIQEH